MSVVYEPSAYAPMNISKKMGEEDGGVESKARPGEKGERKRAHTGQAFTICKTNVN